jgi:hypothetical protein
MLEQAEDDVQQFAHDGDQGLKHGFAARLQLLVEGTQMKIMLNRHQKRAYTEPRAGTRLVDVHAALH